MIVTIDGPAGAGKSSVARRLATALKFHFLDTGAMYRAVALKALRTGADWGPSLDLSQIAREAAIEMRGPHVFLDGEDVSDAIRTVEVTAVTRYAADDPDVRRHLVRLQREFAVDKDVVTEGRDQGTVVFPDAACKIFLTATPEERARRRVNELLAKGQPVNFKEIYEQQSRRDEEDRQRKIAPLVQADDATEVLTDGMTEDEVLEHLIDLVQRTTRAESPGDGT